MSRIDVEFDDRGEVTEYELRAGDPARIWRAMMLAPTLEVCQALLRGESVPVEQLDVEWVSRFGTQR
jgi:hypothetical protein